MVDFHMHTSASDGQLSPEDTVAYAKKQNIDFLSLTDHDSVAGIDAGKQACDALGISIVSGIELSCYDDHDTHVLGYCFDYKDSSLLATIESIKQQRNERMTKMVGNLQKAGFDISTEDVKEHSLGDSIGRPHIALAMIKKGYANTMEQVFKSYLHSKSDIYVGYKKLDVLQGIDTIKKAGGFSCIAHPKLLQYSDDYFYKKLVVYKEHGLDAIEVFYPKHCASDVYRYKKMADRLGLIITGGRDFHNLVEKGRSTMGYEQKQLEKTVEIFRSYTL